MAKSRSKNKDNARRAKKKTSVLTSEGVDYVDWKDVNLLRRFMSERSKVRARRVTGNDAQQQKQVARAIKNAREMALLPYVTRITQQRGPRGERPDRGSSAERPERARRAASDGRLGVDDDAGAAEVGAADAGATELDVEIATAEATAGGDGAAGPDEDAR